MPIQPCQFTLAVPSTTANLGPGFDCLGLALDLTNEWTLTITPDGRPGSCEVVACEGEGCDTLPRDASHYFFANWDTLSMLGYGPNLFSQLKEEGLSARLKAVNRTPLARGLGSSAAVLVASAESYRRLTGCLEFEAWQMASAVERHPDNAAPAALGGLVSGLRADDGVFRAIHHEIHECWKVVVASPDYSVLTEDARRVLPSRVERSQVIFNLSRVSFLLEGLRRGDGELVALGCDDWLHQRQRASLIPGFKDVLAAGREAGAAGVYLSGAGPTVAAFVDTRVRPGLTDHVAAAMQEAFQQAQSSSVTRVLEVDHSGLKVLAEQPA